MTGFHFTVNESHFTMPVTLRCSTDRRLSVSPEPRQDLESNANHPWMTAHELIIADHVNWWLKKLPEDCLSNTENSLTLQLPRWDTPSIEKIRFVKQPETMEESTADLNANQLQKRCIMTVSTPANGSFQWKVSTLLEFNLMDSSGLMTVRFADRSAKEEILNTENTKGEVEFARLYWRHSVKQDSWQKEFLLDFGERINQRDHKKKKFIISEADDWSVSIAETKPERINTIRFRLTGRPRERRHVIDDCSKALKYFAFTFRSTHKIEQVQNGFEVSLERPQRGTGQKEMWEYGLQGNADVHYARVADF